MGASLETPARNPPVCPLCHCVFRNPTALRCKHCFCYGCIKELWSGSPYGPYFCPECKEEYKKLPIGFDIDTTARRGRDEEPTHSRTPAATGREGVGNEVNLFGWRSSPSISSLSKRILGKRPARSPEPGGRRHDNKRAATATSVLSRGKANDSERPITSSSRSSANQNRSYDVGSSSDEETQAPLATKPCNASTSNPRGLEPTGDLVVDLDSQPAAREPPTEAPSGSTGRPSKPTSPARAPGSSNQSPSLSGWTSRESPVPCHYCPSHASLPAVKTCLVCGASMCSDHLLHHMQSPVFRSHPLVLPVDDISPWRCLEHQEMNRIFCRQCSVCVCTVCTVIGLHRDHACVSIREAEEELRGRLKEDMKKMQGTELSLLSRVTELTEKKESFQEESTAVGGLVEQLTQLQETVTLLQHGLHALEGLADAQGATRVQEQAFIMEYGKISKSVSESCSVKELEAPEEVDIARLRFLRQWTEQRRDSVVISLPERDPFRLLYGATPCLDPDTAHPKLLLSEEYRKVAYSEILQAYPERAARFSSFPQVLACKPLQRGRTYWEVEVLADEGKWKVGVCEGQIGRKGQKDTCRIGFNPYSWCLLSERGTIEALHDKVSVPVEVDDLERVGVLVDLDEGSLSFYKVAPGGALSLLHCFKQRFREPLYPALAVSKTQLTITDLFQTHSAQ
uniref:Uncharacterized protein n=1 Tax=Esox lucius TaxID=8010 RepID=A0A3P8ZLT5_ESOLU